MTSQALTGHADGGPRTIPQRLAAPRPSVSFEFMPPKDDAGEAVLWEAIERLEPFAPDFVSVTYGAGGSSQDRTLRITEEIGRRTSLTAMAHLTCVSQTTDDLREVLAVSYTHLTLPTKRIV